MIVNLFWDYFPVSGYPDLTFHRQDADGLDIGPDIPQLLNGVSSVPPSPTIFPCVSMPICVIH